MKSFTTPLALLAALNVQSAAALPSNGGQWSNSTGVAPPAASSDDVHTQAITVSVNCNELINQVLSGISTYPQFIPQAVAVGRKVGLPAGTAFSVCKMFKTDAVDCGYAAGSVAGALSLAISNGYIDLIDEGSDAAEPSRKRTTEGALERFQQQLEDQLRGKGVLFDGISVIQSVSQESTAKTDMGAARLAQIQGVKFPGLETGTDIKLLRHPQGFGSVHVAPSSVEAGTLGRRQGSFGFKVDFEVINRAGTPSAGAYDGLSRIMADDWNSRVTAEQDIGDYIGLFDFGYMGYMQVRVSPEESSFGTDFENVDTCEA